MGKKTSAIPSVERLFNLSMFLISEKYPLTIHQILNSVEGYSPQKDFESNRRMFFRDKSALLKLGLDIRVVNTQDQQTGYETEGYIIEEDDFYLPRISFTPGEAEVLAALSGRFSISPGAHPFPELDWAVMKLTGGSGQHASEGAVLVQMDAASMRPPQKLLDDLRRAVADRKRVILRYRSFNSGRSSRREVDPYGLFIRRGLWYLYGYCHMRRERRMFRVDRVEMMEKPKRGGGPDFELPADFSLARELRRRAPWEFGGDPAKDVEIRFDEDTYWRAKNAWGDLETAVFDDESYNVRLRSMNDTALVHWVLEYAGHAEIISPPALRSKIKETLKGIISNAETGG